MLLDRTHSRWCQISLLILGLGIASYVVYHRQSPNGPTGGSVMGLIYGISGSAMMIFAGLLGARKSLRTWPLGSAQFWLRGHLWIGTLSVPFILFHAGFGWGSLLEQALWLTFALVIISGFFGLAMQQILPRLTAARLPHETFVAQIPFQLKRELFLADRLIADRCGPLQLADSQHHRLLSSVVEFYRDAAKEQKGNWIERIPAAERDLYRSLARHAKDEGWVRTVDDFPRLLPQVYAELPTLESGPAKSRPAGNKPSPLDQMRNRPQPPVGPDDQPAATAATMPSAERKLSPLEIARQQASAKDDTGAPAEAAAPTDKPTSPLDLARQQAEKKAAGEAASAPKKKPSPLELARKQAAQKDASRQDAPPAKKPQPKPAAKPPVKAVRSPAPPAPPPEGIEELKQFYVQTVRGLLTADRPQRHSLGTAEKSGRIFARIRAAVGKPLHAELTALEDCCEQTRQYRLQLRMHRWLHGWLLIHVPISLALGVLFVAHVITALRVVPPKF